MELYHAAMDEIEYSKNNRIQILKVNYQNISRIIFKNKEGESFGEAAFFTGNPRTCCAKSNDFTTLFYIKREDFLKLLIKNPEDYVKF